MSAQEHSSPTGRPVSSGTSATSLERPDSSPEATTQNNSPTPAQAPRGMPRHAGQVERRPLSETMERMIAEPLQSTIARENDPANQLFATVLQNCVDSGNHEMGVFCRICRGIPVSTVLGANLSSFEAFL